MSLSISSTSVRFLLPADVAELNISTVRYGRYGEDFAVGGTVWLDAQKRSFAIALSAGFFAVTPGHRPLIVPSDENGDPLHAAGYYRVAFSGPNHRRSRRGWAFPPGTA